MITAYPGGQFVDHRWRKNVRPSGRNAFFREAVALPEEARRLGAGGHRETLLRGKPGLASNPDAVLVLGNIIDLEQLAAFGPVLNLLDLIVVGVASDRGIDEVRQRENLQQRQTVGVQAVRRDGVVPELRLVAERIEDGDHLPAGIHRLRKIPLAFERGRHHVRS